MTNARSTDGYAQQAPKLVTLYEKYSFDDVFGALAHLFPASPSRVLDLGAGTGRHAAALARRGHCVVAVEPTKELRDAGKLLHADVPLTWVNDAMPELGALASGPYAAPYDFVLMAAVIMHFDEAERAVVMRRVSELLVPGGRCVMSLRHGPVPEGRRMFPVSREGILSQAEPYGFSYVQHLPAKDMHDRPGVSWTMLCLDKTSSA